MDRKPLASEDSIFWTSRHTDDLPPLSGLEFLESLCLELPGSGLVHRRRRSACWPWFRALPGKAWTPVQPPRHWSTLKRTVLWKSHLSEKSHVPISLHCKICDCKRSKLVIYCKSCILKILHYPDKTLLMPCFTLIHTFVWYVANFGICSRLILQFCINYQLKKVFPLLQQQNWC